MWTRMGSVRRKSKRRLLYFSRKGWDSEAVLRVHWRIERRLLRASPHTTALANPQ